MDNILSIYKETGAVGLEIGGERLIKGLIKKITYFAKQPEVFGMILKK